MRSLAEFTAATGIAPAAGDETTYVENQLVLVAGLVRAATGRELVRATYTDTILRPDAMVFLREWPVASIASVTLDGNPMTVTAANPMIFQRAGYLLFDHRPACDALAVEYLGGYDGIPADLASVIDGVVATAWNRAQATGQYVGITASAAEAATSGSGEIKSLNVTDVARVEYDTSSSSSSGSSAGTTSNDEGLPAVNPLAPYAQILSKYRARDAGGAGVRIKVAGREGVALGQIDA